VLAALDLDAPLHTLLERKAGSPYPQPVTAPASSDQATLLALMQEHCLRHVPLLDADGRVVDLVTLTDLLPDQVLPLQAVIMAGGFGTRLRPLTEDLPKPMLTVGGRPIMERIVEQLQQAGIRQVNVTTHYKPEKIIDHFGDGQAFGVSLTYVNEEQPLGTGGALGLIEAPEEPMLVINGDILTRVDFGAMLEYHREHHADMTVAVRQYDLQVPYGVIECAGAYVQGIREKPMLHFLVNAGMYLLEPSVYRYIPKGERFDMPDLIERLLAGGRTVVSFPVVEYWLDIGQHAEYERAQQDARSSEGAV
jgi:NDP-sugar pyrophosphorylase family protein